MASMSLISAQNRVEAPFIIVKIGNYTFGNCDKSIDKKEFTRYKMTFPNYMEGMNIVKINGAVNTYTIRMVYAITQFDDPNLLEKVFSSISSSREIEVSYGDWNLPTYIYKNEVAIVTRIGTNIDFGSSKITYTLQCTSTSLSLKSGVFNFPKTTAKPSDLIIKLLKDRAYGLQDVFKGMSNIERVLANNLIAVDDKAVDLDAKKSITIFDYIGYLVSCMVSTQETGGAIKKYRYFWGTYDDTSNTYGGSYFKVVRVEANCKYTLSYNTYEVDIGYPSGNLVTVFTAEQEDGWAILYNHSKKLKLPEYIYDIDTDGHLVTTASPTILNTKDTMQSTEQSKTWWSNMTQFPIQANLTVKGLLRPAMLMSYLKVNCYFYGKKHVASGLYIITKQEDIIDSNGYRTSLSLTRLSGDEN